MNNSARHLDDVAILEGGRVPPGPAEEERSTQDLLGWTNKLFEQYGNIFQATAHGARAYFVASPEYAQRILRTNWQNYRLGQEFKRIALLLGAGLVVSEGELWKRQRRIIQPAFRDETIGALAGLVAAANVSLLKKWKQAAEEKKTVNVTRDTSLMVLEVVLTAIFGRDYDEIAHRFKFLSDEPVRDLQFVQTFRSVEGTVLKVVSERRTKNVNPADILGMLMAARDRDTGLPMSDGQLVNEVMTLIVAGHETTASVLNWTWFLLSENHDVEQKLSRELLQLDSNTIPGVKDLSRLSYTCQVLDEALRLYPPVWLISRRSVEDDWLGEYFVPAGTQIYISSYFIQRHPALWAEPDRFNPDRFAPAASQGRHPLSMLPFSSGPRNCIGEFLSRLEMQIHLTVIAKELRLRAKMEGTPPELDAYVNLRSKHDFIMTPELKRHANG